MFPKEKCDRRLVKTRMLIRKSLFQLLQEQALKSITVTDIANQAHITRKSFYHSYTNPGEVVAEIEDEIIDNFETVLELLLTPADLKNFNRILQAFTTIIETDYQDYTQLLRKGHLDYHSLLQKLKDSLTKEINQIIPAQLLTDEKDKDVMIIYVVGGFIALYENWLTSAQEKSLEELASETSHIITYGLNGVLKEAI